MIGSPTAIVAATGQVAARPAGNFVAKDGHSAGAIDTRGATPPPLNTSSPNNKHASFSNSSLSNAVLNGSNPMQRNLNIAQSKPNEDSPVLNETLSVIDEHITDMNLPHPNSREDDRPTIVNDSSSEYSSHIDQRLSYIAGNETDEEEKGNLTASEVFKWTPAQVAEHLEDIGIEYKHCEIFKEQEISGDVLLAMDQASIFMKEFNLGLVGQRLRTWHKIKAFQEEVLGPSTTQNSTQNTHLEDEITGERSISSNPTRESSVLHTPVPSSTNEFVPSPQDIPSPRPSSGVTQQLSLQRQDTNATPSSFSFRSGMDSPNRPSAASIRELNHSRRHSAADFATVHSPVTPTEQSSPPPFINAPPGSSHKKAPSLDRNWTMGGPPPFANGRPKSAINISANIPADPEAAAHFAALSPKSDTLKDFDRGYVSGGELESKRARNVLRKREALSANHSRQSSYQADGKRTSHATARRHSRFGSVDSIKDTVAAMAAPASKIYHNNRSHFRNSSANEAVRSSVPASDITSPTVTKLEYDNKRPSMKVVTSPSNIDSSPSIGSPQSTSGPPKTKPRVGLRAISDAVTGSEKAVVTSPASIPSPLNESSRQSPARTGSTTPSGASQNLDRESTDVSSKSTGGPHTGLTPTSGTRRKSKKETSAYVRGLEHKPPQEQMKGCDYSGWMKKKSSNIMTSWKPRLFVLRGRRLSYYYSEDDSQERGLIDISSHRVLPADSDIITGIHAAVTGAKSSPVSPATTHTPTMAAQQAAAQSESTNQKPVSDATFIFKLVPPRSGLSRAVNFTKPTVHYFAVDNVRQGRLWMAALMKATIDRDETKPITTTYHQKTISLVKARAMRHRPPALMGLDEKHEGPRDGGPKSDETGLAIQGLDLEEKPNGGVEHKRTGSLDAAMVTAAAEAAATPLPEEMEEKEEKTKQDVNSPA